MRFANARMYSVNPVVGQTWRSLLAWVSERAQVECAVLDYPPPQPLPALWAREDMGCVFMCGYPLTHATPQPCVLAAPVPSPPAYRAKSVYWTNIVARNDGPLRTIEDTFGKRMAFTTSDSHSGYQALRVLLAPYAKDRDAALFARLVGPLVTPRRVIETVLAGEADAGPVDSYAFDLLRRHEPGFVAPLRVIATTAPTPIPPLVAAAGIASADADRLREALLAAGSAAALAAVRESLLLQGFAAVDAGDYEALRAASQAATDMGYPALR
jgi:ABC-type phosphate/phosphonate transport system substrate-binding protein